MATTPDTIVLIHGLWMTPLSWEKWVKRYTDRGFKVLSPGWPGLEGDPAALRGDASAIGKLTAGDILDHYDAIIRKLDKAPIIMGHSFGGLFTQVLLDRGLGAVGVGVDSATPKGVPDLPLSTLRSAWPILHNPANYHKAVPITPDEFHYAFTNTLSEEESLQVYERYAVPGVGHILFEGALANLNPNSVFRIDYGKSDRAPLLLIAGGEDHIIPASATKHNYGLYHKSKSDAIVAYREFPGRSHYTVGQDGWEAVADFALDWSLDPKAGDLTSESEAVAQPA